MYKVTTNQTIC